MKLAIVFFIYTWEMFEEQKNSKDDESTSILIHIFEEIQNCCKLKVPYFFLTYTKETENHYFSGMQEQALCYEYELFDNNKKPVNSLQGYTVFLRSDCNEILKPLEYLKTLSARLLLSWEDDSMFDEWYKYVKKAYLKRKISEVKKCQLNKTLLEEYTRRGQVFIKTKLKWESFLTDPNFSHFVAQNTINALKDDQYMVISEPLYLSRDELGFLEYRIWVANYRISSISRYSDKKDNYEIPKKIQKFANNFIEDHKTIFPPCYCLDLGIDYIQGVVIIELNGLIATGRYKRNSFAKFLADVK